MPGRGGKKNRGSANEVGKQRAARRAGRRDQRKRRLEPKKK